jgi:hypothetical protein
MVSIFRPFGDPPSALKHEGPSLCFDETNQII